MKEISAVTSKVIEVAVVVLLAPSGAVLVSQRNDDRLMGGYYEFPGGKIEPNESPQQAARREITEELGITVHLGPAVCPPFWWQMPYGRLHLHCFFGMAAKLPEHSVAAHNLRLEKVAALTNFTWLPASEHIISHLRQYKESELVAMQRQLLNAANDN